MAYVKKYKTDAERRLAQSIAGKKGAANRIAAGHNRGGRPKGSRNKNSPAIAEPTRSILVRESAYKVYVKCANCSNNTIVEFMSIVAETLKKRNPQLFAPDAPVVEV